MHLRSISLLGFKSFGDRVQLDFTPGINAIVGPNGSGKSNVVDALRWVAGGGRASAYRAEDKSDLIFHGAEGKRGLNFTEVELRLEAAGKVLHLARSLYRDGQSKLSLGGRAARLMDVEEALAGSGLGRGGLSVIGQGEVGEVLIADPTRLLAYVEEATGVSKLSSRREGALSRLATTREHLARLDDLLAELRRALERLGAEAAQAAHAQALGARSLRLRYTLAFRRHESLVGEALALQEQGRGLKTSLERSKDALEAAQSGWQAAREEVAALELGYREALTRAEAVKGDLRVAEARVENLMGRLASLERERAQRAEESTRLSGLKAPVAPERDLESLQREEQKAAERHEGQRERVRAARGALEAAQAALSALQRQAAAAAQAAAAYESRRDGLMAEMAAAREKKTGLERAQAEDDLGELERAKTSLAEEVRAQAEAVEAARSQLAGVQGEHARAFAQAQALTRQAARVRAAHSARQGYAEGPRHALQSGIAGVVGSVADLITVPPAYALALGSALGRRAEQVVVDTAETAQRVLERLKRAGGRVTLLPLDLIQDRPEGRFGHLDGEPGYLGLVTDLIRFEGRYAPVVRQLLGGTAVVETLEHGVALARRHKRRPRLVTLGGDLIEAYGALTGGKAQTAGAQLIGALAELEAAEREAAEAEAEAAEGVQRVSRLQDGLRDASQRLAQSREALSALERRLAQGREAQAGRTSLIADLSERVARLERTLAELAPPASSGDGASAEARAGEVAELRARLADEDASLAELLEQRTRAAQTLAVSTERWRSFKEERARFEAAEARLTSLRAREEAQAREEEAVQEELEAARRTAESARAALPQDLDEQAARFAQSKRRSQAAEARLAELSGEGARLAAELETVTLSLARRETSLEAAREELSAFPAGLEPLTGSLRAFREELAEAQAALEAIGPVNHRAVLEQAEQRARLGELEAQSNEARAAADELGAVLESIDREVSLRLGSALRQVRGLFVQYSKQLFGGGEADILVDHQDGRPSGLRISLQPPGKTTRSLNLLSVGERTMGAMAFLFALMGREGSQGLSVAILDEVDAPLDEANIRRFCGFLGQLARGGTQFVLVTHQKATMEVADALWGVTTERGVSRVFSIGKDQAPA